VKIEVKEYGNIPRELKELTLNIVNETISATNRQLNILDIYFFEDRSSMAAYLNKEKMELGFPPTWEAEDFYATHDAWLGTPRIMISAEAWNSMDRRAFIGCIRHEIAHAILHGDVFHYVFAVPKLLKQLGQLSSKITYLLAIAVKDYEVTEFLIKMGFIEDQKHYIKHLLSISEEEIQDYMLAEATGTGLTIAYAQVLKIVMCTLPLARIDDEIGKLLESYLTKIPESLEGRVRIIANKVSRSFTGSFKEKLEKISKIFMETLMQ